MTKTLVALFCTVAAAPLWAQADAAAPTATLVFEVELLGVTGK
jgi:hypothetical protein